MIQKVSYLVSIGKFRDYHARGNIAFNKMTLIYADNGTGKTTLTSIFRSLSKNIPELITKRLSTNSTNPQAAQVIQRDDSGNDIFHSFNTACWTSNILNVEIFDIHFINENIYSGFDFTEDHKRKLHSFVMGEHGVTIRCLIEQNKTDKSDCKQRIKVIEDELIDRVSNDLSEALIPEFIRITREQVENIEGRIEGANSLLLSAKSNSVLRGLQHLSILPGINLRINYTEIKGILESSFETIQEKALLDLFYNHCRDLEHNQINEAENWIQTGYKYVIKKSAETRTPEAPSVTCPFCSQSISESIDVIRAYTQRFNEEFNSLVSSIQSQLDFLQNMNLESIIQLNNSKQQENIGSCNTWSAHLSQAVDLPDTAIIINEMELNQAFISLKEVLISKSRNPTSFIETTSVEIFQLIEEKLSEQIKRYNIKVQSYNSAIEAFLTGLPNEMKAQNNIFILNRIQKRFEERVNGLCEAYILEKRNLNNLTTTYPELTTREEQAATTFFNNYRDRINYYLDSVFKTPFQIDSVIHIPPQGRAIRSKISYNIKIDNQDISFDNNSENSAKECLSEGDRSTLALALFFAKLDIDPDLENKIVIIDDPLSSFDSNRRVYTAQIMVELFLRAKQVIILSHNANFLFDISKKINRGDRKTLRIKENFTTKSAYIDSLDLALLVENDYFKHIKALEDFLINPDIEKKEQVLSYMRNIIEAHIKFKFYRQICSIPENYRTFGRLINEIEASGVVFRNDSIPPSIITDLRLINGISCKSHHGDGIPDYEMLGFNPDTISIAELARFAQTTLELIDDKL